MIESARLRLRRPERNDLPALVKLWGDPRVMADLGPVKDRTESEKTFERHCGYWRDGFGFWIVECEGDFAGFAGFKPGAPDTPIEGEIETGWMFAAAYWGRGLAGEAMTAALEWGWVKLHAPRFVAITSHRNLPSRRLMTRLGMRHQPDMDFIHPLLSGDVGRTVTYAIDRPAGH